MSDTETAASASGRPSRCHVAPGILMTDRTVQSSSNMRYSAFGLPCTRLADVAHLFSQTQGPVQLSDTAGLCRLPFHWSKYSVLL